MEKNIEDDIINNIKENKGINNNEKENEKINLNDLKSDFEQNIINAYLQLQNSEKKIMKI